MQRTPERFMQNHTYPEIDSPDQAFMGVKGLVFIGTRLLVYRRDEHAPRFAGYLDLPGGGREPGETPFDTFCREVGEEFGLTVRRDMITYARHYPGKNRPENASWFLAVRFDESAVDNIVFGDEGTEFLLCSFDSFLSRDDAWPLFQERVRQYADDIAP